MSKSQETKTFVVTGGALIPEIPSGAVAVCSRRIPRNGDFIAYIVGGGEPVFRRYSVQNDGSVLLESLNKLYDSYVAKKTDLFSRGEIFVILSIRKEFYPEEELPPVFSKVEETEEKLLTFSEAQTALKVKRTKMYAMLRSGELQASKVGKLWRIHRSSIDSYLSGGIYKPS